MLVSHSPLVWALYGIAWLLFPLTSFLLIFVPTIVAIVYLVHRGQCLWLADFWLLCQTVFLGLMLSIVWPCAFFFLSDKYLYLLFGATSTHLPTQIPMTTTASPAFVAASS